MTPRQSDLLTFLRRRTLKSDVSPSYREMADHLSLKSLSGVCRLLDELERNGHIRRPKMLRFGNVRRGIRVTGIDDYARGYRDGQRDARAEDQAARRLERLEAGLDVTGDISHLLTAGA